MSIGRAVHTGEGRRVVSNMTTPPDRGEQIADIRETIKLNEYLIRYYQDLINDDPDNQLSFQSYLQEIDKRADVIKGERRRLIATYNTATNGEIPSLHKANEVLQSRLKKLKAATPARAVVEARKKDRIIKKAKNLRAKILQLEKDLCDATQTDIEDILEAL